TSLILQIVFSNTAIPPIYFDYITYLGGSFTPLLFLFISLKYSNNKFNLKKIRFLLIIPIIALMFLWTNDLHGLFYKQYSTNLNETVYGPILILYAIYTYFTLIFSMIVLIISSIKKSGFFSIQTGLVVLGIIIPLSANLLGLLKIIPMTIYMTPILFIATSICISISIFKYKALNITPVAFKTVINTMSDAFIVISDDGTIVESNLTFQNIFKDIMSVKKEDNFFNIIDKTNCMNLQELKEHIDKTRENGDIVTDEYHINIDKFNKYFEVDIHPVKASKGKNEYVATLLLFKDITQHKEDIAKIEEKQEIIVKQGQLVSIGELAGGVAHDINTPISAIQTGILMLREMTSERTEQEKEILQRMDNCAVKIINIVNSMRNQIRNLGGDTNVKFKINDVINDIKMITYHEFKKRDAKLNIDIQDDLSIQGDPTKLGQVLTNLVMNGLQAYKEIKGGKIDVILTKAPDNMALIKVTDYAGGIDDSIAPYVFKNILSTKGNVGTGLGLYLAYSVVKGNFNGEITFDTEKNIGTTFYITLPRA
ncbi:MAG: histidine kinase N-terminal 7TM domain-containing protein, partial [Clostridia bacterium]